MPFKVTKAKKGKEVKVAPVAKTTVEHSKTGAVVEKDIDMPMVSVNGAYANVGMQAQRTINLGDYNNVKLGVSIFMPCAPSEQAINETYDFCAAWVDEKMQALTSDHDEKKGET